jgi:integrase
MATIRKHRRKWQVQVRRAGARPCSKSFQVRRDAEEWAREMERRADRQDLPRDMKVLQQTTLGNLVERYVNTITVKKRGAHFEGAVLRRFMSHQICSRRLSELRTEHFAAYRDERLLSIKASTLKRQLNPVRHMFEIARDEWDLPLKQNPLDKLKLEAPDQRRERRLKDGELPRLVEAANSRRNPLIASLVRFAVATAMRRGEMLAMRWKHVNRSQRSLLILDTKNDQSRTIPLLTSALEVLSGLEPGGDNDRVFPITGNAVRLAWERVRLKAGSEDLHFHDLRHEAISRFFEMGLSTPEVALISGHKDMRMLFRYSHATRQNILKRFDSDR